MTRYNTKEQQKLIDDTREEIQQRIRDRIKREENEMLDLMGTLCQHDVNK